MSDFEYKVFSKKSDGTETQLHSGTVTNVMDVLLNKLDITPPPQPPPDPTNTQKLAIASVVASGNDGNLPQNTIDGSLTTRWSNSGYGSWIEYTLTAVSDVNEVKIAFYKGDLRTNGFKVETSDGVAALSLAGAFTSAKNLNLQSFKFAVQPVKKVRVTITTVEGSSWCSITETQVWGVAGTAPPPVGDTTKPTVAIVSPAGGATVTTSAFVSSGTAGDNVGVTGVEVALDSGTFGAASGTTSWTRSFSGVADGSHTITAKAKDAAGNVSDNASVSINVSVPITPPPPTAGTDKNGMLLLQPFAAEGFKLEYFNESFDQQSSSNPTGFDANFRSDGKRYDFDGKRDSVLVAGYYFLPANFSSDEVSAKMNGGPHNDTNPEYADVMDMGIINFAGTASRIRWEKTHPSYSSSISPTYKELPIGSCLGKWRGYIGLKVNLDMDGDGQPDHVGIVGAVDVGGLDSSGKPVNTWKITFKRIFAPNEIGLKSIYTPYVCTIGKCSLAQNTIRIDNSPPDGMQHKFVTCKEIKAVKN